VQGIAERLLREEGTSMLFGGVLGRVFRTAMRIPLVNRLVTTAAARATRLYDAWAIGNSYTMPSGAPIHYLSANGFSEVRAKGLGLFASIGSSAHLSGNASRTVYGRFVDRGLPGTPAYMAPELLKRTHEEALEAARQARLLYAARAKGIPHVPADPHRRTFSLLNYRRTITQAERAMNYHENPLSKASLRKKLGIPSDYE
jgi:hypothetical protein